jgi:hypothetical protein
MLQFGADFRVAAFVRPSQGSALSRRISLSCARTNLTLRRKDSHVGTYL